MGLVALLSRLLPEPHIATAVAGVFLGATWLRLGSLDDEALARFGLSFGGLLHSSRIRYARLLREFGQAIAWAFGAALATFLPFVWAWRAYWHIHGSFALSMSLFEVGNEALGQLVLVALPEEVFYRGYVQSRLAHADWSRFRTPAARSAFAIALTSVLFAVSHVVTIRSVGRLAVFFPSLVFGWLRARTRGVGASVVFHASCNVLSTVLVDAYIGH